MVSKESTTLPENEHRDRISCKWYGKKISLGTKREMYWFCKVSIEIYPSMSGSLSYL